MLLKTSICTFPVQLCNCYLNHDTWINYWFIDTYERVWLVMFYCTCINFVHWRSYHRLGSRWCWTIKLCPILIRVCREIIFHMFVFIFVVILPYYYVFLTWFMLNIIYLYDIMHLHYIPVLNCSILTLSIGRNGMITI